MKIIIISDAHIKSPKDDTYKHILRFFNDHRVITSNEIFLLGDIFDLMCGHHSKYLELYDEYFQLLKKLANKGIIIRYFEGNHDFHVKELYLNFLKKNIFVYPLNYEVTLWEKKYYFSHGDEITFENYGYRIYKKLLRSNILKKAINFVPLPVFEFAGMCTSTISKKLRSPNKFNQEFIKKTFRKYVNRFAENKDFDVLISGHIHMLDDWTSNSSKGAFRYINCGCFKQTQQFICVDEGNVTTMILNA